MDITDKKLYCEILAQLLIIDGMITDDERALLDGVFARQNPGDAPAEPTVDGASAVADDSVDASEDDEHLPPQRREVKKTRGRASVPSWDEIMFGAPKNPRKR